MNKIEELRKAYEAVRPGAWAAVDNTNAIEFAGWELVDLASIPQRTFAIALPQEEARLIALAHNLMPALLAAVATLEQVRDYVGYDAQDCRELANDFFEEMLKCKSPEET